MSVNTSQFSEILRVIDSIQLTATKKVATPANWQVRLTNQCQERIFYFCAAFPCVLKTQNTHTLLM